MANDLFVARFSAEGERTAGPVRLNESAATSAEGNSSTDQGSRSGTARSSSRASVPSGSKSPARTVSNPPFTGFRSTQEAMC